MYVADFGNFKQDFFIMNLIPNSNFRVQDMFIFNNLFSFKGIFDFERARPSLHEIRMTKENRLCL